MFTVTKLALRCGLSRTALLYYESIGLIPPPLRSEGNYRRYNEADLRRLLQIRAYRDAGLKLEDIRAILDRPGGEAAGVLNRRLLEIDA
jgi:DNA-binding transcriptional MerR regulator